MKLSRGLRQAYDVQDFMYECMMALRANLKKDEQVTHDSKTPGIVHPPDKETAQALGTLGKVWRDAQEQIRIHKGKPLPGSLTHEKVRTTKQPRTLSGSMLAQFAPPPEPEQPPEQPELGEQPGEQPGDAA